MSNNLSLFNLCQFDIRAEDNGTPRLQATSKVTIRITQSSGLSFTPATSEYQYDESILTGTEIEMARANNAGDNVSSKVIIFNPIYLENVFAHLSCQI